MTLDELRSLSPEEAMRAGRGSAWLHAHPCWPDIEPAVLQMVRTLFVCGLLFGGGIALMVVAFFDLVFQGEL